MNILTPWADCFVAQAGAAGALTGLIFVALSFNFDQIIGDEAWLGRAGTGLILLAQPIAYALVCLWPARTATPPGWTATALAALAAVIVTRIVLRHPGQAPASTPGEQASRLVITLTEPAATAAGAALVATGHAAGAYVQASAALAGLAVGLVTAWILLVEVRRARPATGGPVTGDHLRSKRRTEPEILSTSARASISGGHHTESAIRSISRVARHARPLASWWHRVAELRGLRWVSA
jgi:hypothetical protein